LWMGVFRILWKASENCARGRFRCSDSMIGELPG
jgi:hypothetical protein